MSDFWSRFCLALLLLIQFSPLDGVLGADGDLDDEFVRQLRSRNYLRMIRGPIVSNNAVNKKVNMVFE